ncbi:peptide ABC transporter substrate-binding protein [Sinimarinibacterium thermocellulolyticum]|uniref:Peptide ABC transporter substrate-binding protein n=1 Tax=Sinimarinibacterium thermocellulolyticum TaxID=3170016 RepID=A0ABV2A6E1_9GAMM
MRAPTFVLALVLSCPSAWATATEVLRIGNGPEPETLDPHRVEGVSAGNIVRDLFEGLTAVGDDGAPVPAAAESWSVGADGLRYRFRLRDDLRWSNGDPLVAADFVRGLRRSVAPSTGSHFARMLEPIRNAAAIIDGRLPADTLGVHAPDAQTLEIELEAPNPTLPALLAHPCAFPLHADNAAASTTAFARPGRLISNGAYRLADWVVQSHVALVRNEHYRDPAAIARVHYVVTEDIHAELQRFRAGELDITAEIPPLQAERIRRELPGALRVAPYLGVYYYGLNLTRPPFAGAPQLRRALSMVIDRELLVQKVLHGLGLPAYGFVPPKTAGHVPQTPAWSAWPLARRIEEARRLYRQAGYGQDRPLQVEIRYNTHETHRRIATVVAAMWKQTLGVQTRLVNEEFKVFLHHRRLRRDTQVFRAAWMADFNDPMSFLGILHSAHGKNDSGWVDADFDAHLAVAAASVDGERRAEALAAAERRVLEDVPVIPLYVYVSKHLVAPRVRGWRDHPLDYHYSKDLTLADSQEGRG